ncbi:Xylose isomerase domain-containing protein TIM barrel [Planctomycetales bacterium 10988]|nr:Xylose isomerase domain-containing protein TIM barrel [Planctomycetales bacterium 10988]
MFAHPNRRSFLQQSGVLLGALGSGFSFASEKKSKRAVRYCFNTSTVREKKIPLPDLCRLVAEAGYDSIEPWFREMDTYRAEGGNLSDLGKLISDLGLKVESGIGFARWIVDDPKVRKEALEEAKLQMDQIKQLGGHRIAAPPAGATRGIHIAPEVAAERYRELLKVGESLEVTPQLEVWGFSSTMGRLDEVIEVMKKADHPRACILPDVYHLYKGGSDFADLLKIPGHAMQMFHLNDYPPIVTTEIADADRVYPGDGVAPYPRIMKYLQEIGFEGAFSIELFNPDYWKQDPLEVARTSLKKMKAVTTEFA